MNAHRWTFEELGKPNVFPRRVRDMGLPGRLYRERKWALRVRVRDYIVRDALRLMNEAYRDTGDTDPASLVTPEKLLERARQADTYGVLRTDVWGVYLYLDAYEADKTARAAHDIAARIWTPDLIDTASLAGRMSKRGPSFTLEDYAQVRHTTGAQGARLLGCSLSTIRRLARQWRERLETLRGRALEHARRNRDTHGASLMGCQVTRIWGTTRDAGNVGTMPRERRATYVPPPQGAQVGQPLKKDAREDSPGPASPVRYLPTSRLSGSGVGRVAHH